MAVTFDEILENKKEEIRKELEYIWKKKNLNDQVQAFSSYIVNLEQTCPFILRMFGTDDRAKKLVNYINKLNENRSGFSFTNMSEENTRNYFMAQRTIIDKILNL